MIKASKDTHWGFRTVFYLEKKTEINFEFLVTSQFVTSLDEKLLIDGPSRYKSDKPQTQSVQIELTKGSHVLAVHVHHYGLDTRMMENMDLSFNCRAAVNGNQLNLNWKYIQFDAYKSCIRRINPQLGWMEWCDLNKMPENWKNIHFDDSYWKDYKQDDTLLKKSQPNLIKNLNNIHHKIKPIDEGKLVEKFSYDKDDPPTKFFLRDLDNLDMPHEGIWRRYDLKKIRLGRPSFIIDCPKGSIVEFGYAESLTRNRVAPYINASLGPSANMDHFIAAGSNIKFEPVTPKGMRFLEVHVLSPSKGVKFIEESFIERTYFSQPKGHFTCQDQKLNSIWNIGVETLRSCSEDALTDNPTRERGQWLGDLAAVGLSIADVAYGDLDIVKKGLIQSAQCANKEGMVAGMSPGGVIYLSSFAIQWTTACIDYYKSTGDKNLLHRLFQPALENVNYFKAKLTDRGLVPDNLEWAFIDWGYSVENNMPDIALTCHFLESVRAFTIWCCSVDAQKNLIDDFYKLQNNLIKIINSLIGDAVKKNDFKYLGYHTSVLALRNQLIPKPNIEKCIEYIKNHITSSFPNKYDAPRLARPFMNLKQVITPYFSHFALDTLIKYGHMKFVIDQYKNCWGWFLEKQMTTWPEVFDLRWSHCHSWSGCPTWQLSRYCLGLHPRFDIAPYHYDFIFRPGYLNEVKGKIPLGKKAIAEISWQKDKNKINYNISADRKIWINNFPARENGKTEISMKKQNFVIENTE